MNSLKPHDELGLPEMFASRDEAQTSGESPRSPTEPITPTPAKAEPEIVPAASGKASSTNAVLWAVTLSSLLLSGYSLWRVQSLSYYDIPDSPIFYYASEEDLGKAASKGQDPTGFANRLIETLQEDHAILFNRNAVLVAAPEFKLVPSTDGKEKE